MDPKQQDVQNAFQQLYDNLTSADWAASTIEDKDRIRGYADGIFQILSQLMVDDIKSRSAEFQELKNSVQSVTKKLDQLQTEIDGIIHNIQIASSVVAGITKAVGMASQFLS
jgi:ABC-type transporter Mla subunit MlaD